MQFAVVNRCKIFYIKKIMDETTQSHNFLVQRHLAS